MLNFIRRKASKQRVYCVSHEAPLVPTTLTDFEIGVGEYFPKRGAHVSKFSAFWDEMRPYAYGAAGNYVIPDAIKAAAPTELTGIFSHRKIIVRTQIGKPAPYSNFYFEVAVEDAARLPREEIEPRPGLDFLVGLPMTCEGGMVRQYIVDHRGIDLFEYTSMAVEIGVLSLDEAQAFATEPFFIPGGCESGVYPTAWLLPVLEKLERVGREFVTRRRERLLTYDNFQVRAVGFLAERLGSYFLLAELRKRYPQSLPRALFGQLCVIVVPGNSYEPAKV